MNAPCGSYAPRTHVCLACSTNLDAAPERIFDTDSARLFSGGAGMVKAFSFPRSRFRDASRRVLALETVQIESESASESAPLYAYTSPSAEALAEPGLADLRDTLR